MKSVTLEDVKTRAPSRAAAASTPSAVCPGTGSSVSAPRTSPVTPRSSVSGSRAPASPPPTAPSPWSAVTASACPPAPVTRPAPSMRDVFRDSACVSFKKSIVMCLMSRFSTIYFILHFNFLFSHKLVFEIAHVCILHVSVSFAYVLLYSHNNHTDI